MALQYFNKRVFVERIGGDNDAIISILSFAVSNNQDKFKETKNYTTRNQLYRFAHFMKGTCSNVSFDICAQQCKELLDLTEPSKSENDKSITPEMKEKLDEIGKSLQLTCGVVDAYISSKSG